MKVILPGGAGFVGRNLIRVMINEGFKPEDMTVIDRNERNMEFLEKYQVKKIIADLSEKVTGITNLTVKRWSSILQPKFQLLSTMLKNFSHNRVCK